MGIMLRDKYLRVKYDRTVYRLNWVDYHPDFEGFYQVGASVENELGSTILTVKLNSKGGFIVIGNDTYEREKIKKEHEKFISEAKDSTDKELQQVENEGTGSTNKSSDE